MGKYSNITKEELSLQLSNLEKNIKTQSSKVELEVAKLDNLVINYKLIQEEIAKRKNET